MNNEQRPSSERLQKPKAVRIETETGIIHGSLFSAEESQRTISVMGFGGEVEYLLRFDVNGLKVNEPFEFEYSLDGGESWQLRTSDSPLKGLKTWERASKVLILDDLIDRTVRGQLQEDIDDEPYKQFPEYSFDEEALVYAQENPDEAKISRGFNVNTGWKIHLTPHPEHITELSRYLKENGYYHKYLSGGFPSDGKAFTVYLGSRQMMEKWTAELEQVFADKLLPALAENEEVVTPHISARFTSIDKDDSGESLFHQYGVNGMCAVSATMKKRYGKDRNFTPLDVAESQKVASEAYDELSKRYGSYFHG